MNNSRLIEGIKGWIEKHFLLLFVSVISLALILSFIFSLPRQIFQDPFSTILEDRYGTLLGAKIAADEQWRFPPLDMVPEKYEKAVICFEDQYFYYHPGINPFSLLRALRDNLRAGEIVRGGSTISMQVIRLSRSPKPRNIYQKILEMILALGLELRYKKTEILCMYASHAPFGGNVVGLEAASWRYFGRSPRHLSWAESATLAVLPNSPSLIYPGKNQEMLQAKRNSLLDRLFEYRIIDSVTCALSKLEPLPGIPMPLPDLAPHLLMKMHSEQPGKRILSTLDAGIQSRVNEILSLHHRILTRNKIHNAAALVMEVESGKVLAYAGNIRDPDHPEHGGEVDVIQARRSTGSILKPILFTAMIDEGSLLPGSLVADIPTFFPGFSPKNFSPEFDGAIPAYRALSRSLNVPAVMMLQSFGVAKFQDILLKFGLQGIRHPPEHYGLSLILGGAETSLWELAGMYGSLGRILVHFNRECKYYPGDIHYPVTEQSWTILEENAKPRNTPTLFSAASIWICMQSLLEVNRPDSETGWEYFSSSRKVAWKTGTSFGFRDAWSIGTTPEYLVAVWAGNADGEGRPGLTGTLAAAPVMFEIFNLLSPSGWFVLPADELYPARICRESGYLAGQFCEQIDTILVPQKGLGSAPCPYHILVHLDSLEKFQVHRDCYPETKMKHKPWFVLPPVMEWYYKSKNTAYKVIPPYAPGCRKTEEEVSMQLIYPRSNANVYIPVELDGTRGAVIFEATHRDQDQLVYWHLDNNFLGVTKHIHQMDIRAEKGMHTITLVDQEGEVLSQKFQVVDRK